MGVYRSRSLGHCHIGNAFIGRFSNKPFTIKDLRISLFALIVTHIQLLIGLILYFVSPRFSAWQEGMGAVMGDSTLRLYLVEHPITNILAVVLITIGLVDAQTAS